MAWGRVGKDGEGRGRLGVKDKEAKVWECMMNEYYRVNDP